MPFNINEIDGVQPIRGRFPVDVIASTHELSGPEHTGQLIDSQIPSNIMRKEDHQNDPHTMIIDGRDVSADGSKLDTIESGAEVNNITDAQAQSLTDGTHSSWHHHDDFYYRKTQLQLSFEAEIHWTNLTNIPLTFPPSSHVHDDRYYTEPEIDSLISSYSLVGHNHDDRYYTEPEIDTLLDTYYTKTDLNSGQLDNRYFTEAEITTNYYDKTSIDSLIASAAFGIVGSVSTFGDLPIGTDIGEIYIVQTTVEPNEEGFYRWDGSSWNFLANNTGISVIDHGNLSGLEDDDHLQYLNNTRHNLISGNPHNVTFSEIIAADSNTDITTTELEELTNNLTTSLHNHDDKYFTKLEITSNYYAKNQLNTGQLDSRYYTESEIDSFLSNKSNVSHTHDDRYYTETEIDDVLSNYSNVGHLHDDRYYKKNEVDGLLDTKSNISHIHDERYFTETELSSNSGTSGAKRIGTSFIGGITSTNVQDVLQELKIQINSSVSSLQEAYEVDPKINIISNPVEINASSKNTAPLQITQQPSAPTNGLAAGQITVVDNELYLFNVDKNKWLTPSKSLGFGRRGVCDGHLLMAPGGVRSKGSGFKMAKNGTIISIAISSTSPNSEKEVYINLNENILYTITTDNSGCKIDKNINIDFNEGDVISSLVSSSGQPIRDVTLVFEYAWRI